MVTVFLLAAAVGVIAVALLFVFWRNVDQRVQQAYGDDTIEELTERLEDALEQQQHLVSRVEHLEAIVASEPWETARQGGQPAPPLTLPDAEADESSGERAGRRQQSR